MFPININHSFYVVVQRSAAWNEQRMQPQNINHVLLIYQIKIEFLYIV